MLGGAFCDNSGHTVDWALVMLFSSCVGLAIVCLLACFSGLFHIALRSSNARVYPRPCIDRHRSNSLLRDYSFVFLRKSAHTFLPFLASASVGSTFQPRLAYGSAERRKQKRMSCFSAVIDRSPLPSDACQKLS